MSTCNPALIVLIIAITLLGDFLCINYIKSVDKHLVIARFLFEITSNKCMWEENEKGRLSSSNLLVANPSIKKKKKKTVLDCFLGHPCVHVGVGKGSPKDESCFLNPSSLWQSMMNLLICTFVVLKGSAGMVPK